MMIKNPYTYWRSNSDWYYFDYDLMTWVMRDNAPEEAKRDHEKYLNYFRKVCPPEFYDAYEDEE